MLNSKNGFLHSNWVLEIVQQLWIIELQKLAQFLSTFAGILILTISEIIQQLPSGNFKALAKAISIVENNLEGTEEILASLSHQSQIPIIGVTGPPGAGKSSLVNELAFQWSKQGKKVAIVAVDPASPFHQGSLLGDRHRMQDLMQFKGVFIRSLSSRGSLGGLTSTIFEVIELIKNAYFDLVIIETVGIGQSEVEICGIADTTILVLVPESGDEVQTIKSGVMEIADIFVINKCDRPGAEKLGTFVGEIAHKNSLPKWEIPVVYTSATEKKGIDTLSATIFEHYNSDIATDKKVYVLIQKIYQIIAKEKMKNFDRENMLQELKIALTKKEFQLFQFAKKYYNL